MRRRHARWVSATAVVVAWALAPAAVASAQPADPAAGERPVTVVQRWIPAGPDLKDGTASIRVVVADPAALASPVLLVAERSPQPQWDRFAAKGYAIAHLELPADPRGCPDDDGPQDAALMRYAAGYLGGELAGYADADASVPAPAEFSDGHVAAVGDGTGGSPYLLGSDVFAGTVVDAVVAVDAASDGRYPVPAAAPAGTAPDAAARVDAVRDCRKAAAARPTDDPYWQVRNHLPDTGRQVPTLTVSTLGTGNPAGPQYDQRLTAGSTHQLYLTAAADSAASDEVVLTWLDRYLNRTAGSALPAVLVQQDADRVVPTDGWPGVESVPVDLTVSGTSLVAGSAPPESAAEAFTEPLTAALRLSGQPRLAGALSAGGVVDLVWVDARANRHTIATTPILRDTMDLLLPPVQTQVPAGARIGFTLTSENGAVARLSLPVSGGPAALSAALSDSASPDPEPTPRISPPVTGPPVATTAAPTTPVTTAPSGRPTTSTLPGLSTPVDTGPRNTPTPPETATGPADPTGTEPSANAESGVPARPSSGNDYLIPGNGSGAAAKPAGTTDAGSAAESTAPQVLTMMIDDANPVQLPEVSLRGTDAVAVGTLRPIRVMGPDGGVGAWNLTGQVSDFRAENGVILADNLGWAPTVDGGSGNVTPGPVAQPGSGTGLEQFRVLCSGKPTTAGFTTVCGGELRLGVPANARSGHYTALLTLTLI